MMDRFNNPSQTLLTQEEVEAGGITTDHVLKWQLLQELQVIRAVLIYTVSIWCCKIFLATILSFPLLQDRNETLFYRLLAENFVEMAPIIYTPTVGYVCKNWHKLYRRPRGMYFSALDKGEMTNMVFNWPSDTVDAIVVTDGSRILGLGDLGANGLGIPIGKLDLYVAAGGFNPQRVLPCIIDVGTDNVALREDPWYIGLNQPRLRGDAYYEVIDEFVTAVMGRWPNAVLQFEDFSTVHAASLLERYRYSHCVFNDDIQGTAATAVAGLIGAMAVKGLPPSALVLQKIVMVGAGSAGLGVTKMIAQGMVRHGLTEEQAQERFYILDAEGLITVHRKNLDINVAPFARRDAESKDGERLVDVIKRVKPTALIGLSGAGRLFTKDALELMAECNEQPIIMPMSNPTSKMECLHAETQEACQGRAIYACGSPQPDIVYNGKTYIASQANNMYIFPGVALGSFLSWGNIITDRMLMTAAESLPGTISPADKMAGRVYPPLSSVRDISLHIACQVIKAAAADGHVANPALLRALNKNDEDDAALRRYVHSHMYWPDYTSLVAPGPHPPNPRAHFG